MAYTDIDKPTDYFNTKLYTGDGTSSNAITGVGFQPDWVWLKARSSAYSHQLFDSVRGATKLLSSEETSAEQTLSGVTAFGSDGFTVGSDAGSNNNTTTFASWNWLAGGSASSNTDGSITSSVSANTTAGFSIVSYTGTGSTATVGHGLGVTPKIIILKKRDSSGTDWITWGSILGGTVGSEFIKLNATNGKTTGLNSSWFNNTAPTSSVFTIGTQSDLNGSSATYIAYCFAEKKGYSKFGSYTGNGSTDGTFVYTGFKPAFILAKKSSGTGDWGIYNNKSNSFNVMDLRFKANTSAAEDESSDNNLDFLSNGFKHRTASGWNASATYIYMAFASSPFVTSTGIPSCAR